MTKNCQNCQFVIKSANLSKIKRPFYVFYKNCHLSTLRQGKVIKIIIFLENYKFFMQKMSGGNYEKGQECFIFSPEMLYAGILRQGKYI